MLHHATRNLFGAVKGPRLEAPAEQPDVELPAETEVDDYASPAELPPALPVRWWRGFWSIVDWCVGAVSVIGGLAILASVPVLNLLSLGYLLEASGRVARTGRLRDGFVGIRKAAVVGRIVFLSWLLILPVRFVAGLSNSAETIDPGGPVANRLRIGLVALTILTVLHIVWAVLRGGRLMHFVWPGPIRFIKWLRHPTPYSELRDRAWDVIASLRLPHYLWLGLRGLIGAVVWLAVPVGLMVLGSQIPSGAGVAISLVGGLFLAVVVLYLPFCQTRFAAEDRFGAMFEIGRVRQLFSRAPVAFWVSLLITLAFALPLYLLKIELTPAEVTWLPSLLFVVFIFPARLLVGWAVARGERRDDPRHGFFRWGARLGALPLVGVYALLVYASQYVSWYGAYSLLEQHAFLVPAPILGL